MTAFTFTLADEEWRLSFSNAGEPVCVENLDADRSWAVELETTDGGPDAPQPLQSAVAMGAMKTLDGIAERLLSDAADSDDRLRIMNMYGAQAAEILRALASPKRGGA